MIQVTNLRKAYGQQLLFDDVALLVEPGERIGLVGANGHGKTTLFRMITGEEPVDSGEIVVPRGYTIGYLSQELRFEAPSVFEEACLGLEENEDGYLETYKAQATLLGLGLQRDEFEKAPSELSGGFQVRLNLAKVLLSEPNLLLLDEPNNYLDIVSLRWLRRFLRGWRNELMIITHDREFMDSVTSHTVAIHRRRVRKMRGSTAKILSQIALEEELHEKTRINEERKQRQEMRFIERFRAKATKASVVQSRIKQMGKRQNLEKLEEIPTLGFSFKHAPFNGKWLLECRDLAFAYEEGELLIDGLDLTVHPGDRVGVIGRNGRGKSTLLRLLAGELSPIRGQVRAHVNHQLAHFGQSHVELLDPEKTVEEEVLSAQPQASRTDARGICGLMMFEGDDALKRVRVLSGGERSRVLLGKILASPSNLLLLDEPTNHLDISSSEALQEAIVGFPGGVVLVTHSERTLHELANRLVVFDGGRVSVHEWGYQDFLDRTGWQEERGEGGPAPPRKRRPRRKERRRERAEIVAARSRALKPLRRKIDAAEAEIMKLEEKMELLNSELLEASRKGEAHAIASLSRDLHRRKTRIEELFQNLEALTTDHDRTARDFEARLAELEE
ncbi:MAG: ABC-F family ATP-binding cassette domain-containing protein [Planctomycetota bacterium]